MDLWDELGSGETEEGSTTDCDDEDGCQASGDDEETGSKWRTPIFSCTNSQIMHLHKVDFLQCTTTDNSACPKTLSLFSLAKWASNCILRTARLFTLRLTSYMPVSFKSHFFTFCWGCSKGGGSGGSSDPETVIQFTSVCAPTHAVQGVRVEVLGLVLALMIIIWSPADILI